MQCFGILYFQGYFNEISSFISYNSILTCFDLPLFAFRPARQSRRTGPTRRKGLQLSVVEGDEVQPKPKAGRKPANIRALPKCKRASLDR